MDFTFLDTSALLKLYLPERGSNWLKNFTRGRQIIIAELALIEAATVLKRLYLEGTLTRIQAFDLFAQIKQDSIGVEIVAIGGEPFRDRLAEIVLNLAAGFRIRALDAIHLTAADLAVRRISSLTPPPAFVFVTADRQLLRAAQGQGFSIETPENYL